MSSLEFSQRLGALSFPSQMSCSRGCPDGSGGLPGRQLAQGRSVMTVLGAEQVRIPVQCCGVHA